MSKLNSTGNRIGIIGGSGLYKLDAIENIKLEEIDTPYGKPSDKIVTGEIGGVNVAFLARHGAGHKLNPSEVNYRANLYAMKVLGVNKLISSTAVGSLKENIKPTHLLIPDQYIDNTFKREKTYFEKGIVAHVSMANPVCPFYTRIAYDTAKKMGLETHFGGTYFNMEGPQFSSKAESESYRRADCSVIGMTQALEAKFAKELEMCFIPLAFITDYDCWHPETEHVTAEMVVENLNKNISSGLQLIKKLITAVNSTGSNCGCNNSLEGAVLTDLNHLQNDTLKRMRPIIEKYLKKEN
ncbi:MAG: S-methyl-5'-thioadenosine phosphorylase [Candidatus Aminicenantes bacterium]|nr:S-methyl-5'-thioadenosine phosphorylase [Candidatus Aminicenantes bacterium]